MLILLGFIAGCVNRESMLEKASVEVSRVPAVTSVIPTDDLDAIPVNAKISVVFSLPMDTASVEGGFSYTSASSDRAFTSYDGLFEWSEDYTSFRFIPTSSFDPEAEITISIASSAQSAEEINLSAHYSWSFHTSSDTYSGEPWVVNVSPSLYGVAFPTQAISIEFDRHMDRSTVEDSFIVISENADDFQDSRECEFSWNQKTVTCTLSRDLRYDTTYTVALNNNNVVCRDIADNPMYGGFTSSFYTIENEAVYVSNSGDTANSGYHPLDPTSSINDGIEKAQALGVLWIKVAAGSYFEDAAASNMDGLLLEGGWDDSSGDWVLGDGECFLFADTSYALTLDGIGNCSINGIDFYGGSGASGEAGALKVSDCPSVRIQDCTLHGNREEITADVYGLKLESSSVILSECTITGAETAVTGNCRGIYALDSSVSIAGNSPVTGSYEEAAGSVFGIEGSGLQLQLDGTNGAVVYGSRARADGDVYGLKLEGSEANIIYTSLRAAESQVDGSVYGIYSEDSDVSFSYSQITAVDESGSSDGDVYGVYGSSSAVTLDFTPVACLQAAGTCADESIGVYMDSGGSGDRSALSLFYGSNVNPDGFGGDLSSYGISLEDTDAVVNDVSVYAGDTCSGESCGIRLRNSSLQSEYGNTIQSAVSTDGDAFGILAEKSTLTIDWCGSIQGMDADESAGNGSYGMYLSECSGELSNIGQISSSNGNESCGLYIKNSEDIALVETAVRSHTAAIAPGIYIAYSSDITIQDSSEIRGGQDGPLGRAVSVGIDIIYSDDVTITGSTIKGYRGTEANYGIRIDKSESGFVIQNNDITGGEISASPLSAIQESIGIVITDAAADIAGNTVRGNVASNSAVTAGIKLSGGSNTSTVHGNPLVKGGEGGTGTVYGITITNGAAPAIYGNELIEGGTTEGNTFGVYASGGSVPSIYRNTIIGGVDTSGAFDNYGVRYDNDAIPSGECNLFNNFISGGSQDTHTFCNGYGVCIRNTDVNILNNTIDGGGDPAADGNTYAIYADDDMIPADWRINVEIVNNYLLGGNSAAAAYGVYLNDTAGDLNGVIYHNVFNTANLHHFASSGGGDSNTLALLDGGVGGALFDPDPANNHEDPSAPDITFSDWPGGNFTITPPYPAVQDLGYNGGLPYDALDLYSRPGAGYDRHGEVRPTAYNLRDLGADELY